MSFSRIVTALLCAALTAAVADARPRPRRRTGQPMRLIATAYCQHGTTDSGAPTERGTIAADPRVLPMGSGVRIESPDRRYSGTYTVADTGAKIKGRKVDIFVPSCANARKFGKRPVLVRLLRRGSTNR